MRVRGGGRLDGGYLLKIISSRSAASPRQFNGSVVRAFNGS